MWSTAGKWSRNRLRVESFPYEAATMAKRTFRSSGIDNCRPKPLQDPTLRRMKHGPIQPMKQPSLIARLFGRPEL